VRDGQLTLDNSARVERLHKQGLRPLAGPPRAASQKSKPARERRASSSEPIREDLESSESDVIH